MVRNSSLAVILNARAGRSQAGSKWDLVEPEFLKAFKNARIYRTTHPGHGTELAQLAIHNGASIVIAAGGDGTINEVVTGLIGSGSALGVFPLGTGNDFARTLGIRTVQEGIHTIATGLLANIDVIQWTASGRTGYGINVAGCGFDAEVAARINCEYRWLRGTPAYIAAVLECLTKYQPTKLEIKHDRGELEVDAMLVAVANAQSYGGGMRIGPDADLTDGLLDVVIVQSVSKFQFIKTFRKVFAGTHLSHPRVVSFRTSGIEISATHDVPVLVDGEIVGVSPANFIVLPGEIRCVIPRI